MEKITLEEVVQVLINQLESKLARIALCAESGLSTFSLENDCKALASKIKNSVEMFSGLDIYKGDNSNKLYSPQNNMNDMELTRYAWLCKKCGKTQLEVHKFDGEYFVEINNGLFVKLYDIPEQILPQFKVKLDGNTLMGIRSDLVAQLPSSVQKLLGNSEE
ncbi:MAG: hypothetical protein WC389_11825 [Lutibacter sp.]|jgi:hypothetical protein